MSGVVNTIKKVFKKVVDFIKPIAKVVLIAAAIYFTAGVAMSYFGATSAFAASMPGFAANGVAGAGVFSHAAASIGLGGGLAHGAAIANAATAASAAGAAGGGATAYALGAQAPAAGTAAVAENATAAGAEVAGTAGTGAATTAGAVAPGAVTAGTVAPAAATTGATLGAKIAGASLTDKLLMASLGTNLVSGLTAPSVQEVEAAKKSFYGSFYGVDSSGKGAPAPMPYAQANAKIPGVAIPGQNTAYVDDLGKPSDASSTQQSALAAKLIPDIPYSGQPLAGSRPDYAVQGSTPLVNPRIIPS